MLSSLSSCHVISTFKTSIPASIPAFLTTLVGNTLFYLPFESGDFVNSTTIKTYSGGTGVGENLGCDIDTTNFSLSTTEKKLGTASLHTGSSGSSNIAITLSPWNFTTSFVQNGFSWAFFIKTASIASVPQMIFNNLSSTGVGWSIHLQPSGNNRLVMAHWQQTGTTNSFAYDFSPHFNTWTHVCFTITSSGTITLYINGTSVSNILTQTPRTITSTGSSNPITIGYVNNSTLYSTNKYPLVNSYLDDFRVYAVVLTQSQAQTLSNLTS